MVLEKTGYNPEEDRIIKMTKWDPKKLDAMKRKAKVMDMAWKPSTEDTGKDEDEDDGGQVIVLFYNLILSLILLTMPPLSKKLKL